MALQFKSSAVRIAFLTGTAFNAQGAEKVAALKKNALRVLMQRSRTYCIEDATNPDVVFEVRRLPGRKGWCLHRRSYNV